MTPDLALPRATVCTSITAGPSWGVGSREEGLAQGDQLTLPLGRLVGEEELEETSGREGGGGGGGGEGGEGRGGGGGGGERAQPEPQELEAALVEMGAKE